MQQRGLHPDLGGDTRLASELNKAYATLYDPKQRSIYDRKLHQSFTLSQKSPANNKIPYSGNYHTNLKTHGSPTITLLCNECGSTNTVVVPKTKLKRPLKAIHCGLCQAIITLHRHPTTRQRERRHTNKRVSIYIDRNNSHEGRLVDLSDRGGRLVTFAPIQTDQPIGLVAPEFEARGQIRWSQNRPGLLRPLFECGISFATFESTRPSALVHCRV